MDCSFEEHDGFCVCSRPECRRKMRKSHRPCSEHYGMCGKQGSPPLYLGDRVEIWLSNLGITPARIIACKKACGLKPKCGCNKRKSWLNQLDKRVRRLFG